MSYCMWENTSKDLYDAREKIESYLYMTQEERNEDCPSTYEIAALKSLLDEAKQIVDMEGDIEDLYEDLLKIK